MPGSWELVAARDKRLLVAILMPPDLAVTMDFAQNIRNIQLPPGSDFMRMAGLPFGPARNQCAKTAMENNYHLAFLDADLRVPPDAYVKLLETGLDLVGGLYFQRFAPYQPVMFNEGKDDKGTPTKVPITGWKPGDIVPATFIPSGLTIYRRRLLEAMFARYPRPFEWGVDVSPIPAENGQVPPFCVLPGQEIYGGSPVETAKVGEEIIDQFGRLSKLMATFQKQYDGDIITVTPRCMRLPVKVTPEHQFLTKLSRSGQELWLQAKDLRRGHLLAFPQLYSLPRDTLDLWPFLPNVPLDHEGNLYEDFTRRVGKWDTVTRRNRIPRRLPLSDTFMELCGWFIAEGSTSVDKRDGIAADVRYTVGPHETTEAQWLLDATKQVFHLSDGSIVNGDHALIVYFRSPILHRLFRLWFGEGAAKKHMPSWALSLPPDRLIPLLRGLWRGDGHQTYSGRPARLVMGFRTKSGALALDVAAILVKLGIRPTVRKYQQGAKSFSGGRSPIYHVVVHYDSARLCELLGWPVRERLPHYEIARSFIEGGRYWFPIDRLEHAHYSGSVHDLSVDPGHSYILGPVITHNSEDFTFTWRAKQLGFQPFVHTGVVGLHEVRAVVGPKWLLPYPSNDPYHGVVAVT